MLNGKKEKDETHCNVKRYVEMDKKFQENQKKKTVGHSNCILIVGWRKMG
jgi:hypothetical protein